MDRRTLLKLGMAAAAVPAIASCGAGREPGDPGGRVMTVRGPMPAGDMGLTLTHEHLFADVRPYEEQLASPIATDRDEVAEVVLPYLEAVKAAGARTVVDATAVGLGRNPAVLRRLSEESGLNVLTTTGVYLAADGRFVPDYAREDDAEELAARFVRDWEDGIDGTGIRPGMIKLSVNGGPLSDLDRKMIDAAAIAHLATGLVIGTHIGPWGPSAPGANGEAATALLDALAESGVAPSAFIWIHAQNEAVPSFAIELAQRGAFVSFDGYRPGQDADYAVVVGRLREAGLLGRLHLSQDAGWYTAGEPRGGEFAPFAPILTDLVPHLRDTGMTDEEFETVFVANPARAFAIGVRRRA